MIANNSVKDGKFGIVPLSSNCRHVSVDANAFLLQMQLGPFEPVMPTTSFLTKFASFILPIGHKILI